MPRKIAFRAWDKGGKTMFQVTQIDWQDELIDVYEQLTSFRFKNVELMQFTGLLDKNGKEIYENDIVCLVQDVVVETIGGHDRYEPEGKFLVVTWNQLHCGWGLFENGSQSSEMLADWINEDGSTPKNWECKELEIVGNIYENEELLK